MEELLKQLIKGQEEIKGQLNENTEMIKALVHWTEELDAKYENLLHSTATKDSIVNLDSKFDLLNDRLFQQEAKILTLIK